MRGKVGEFEGKFQANGLSDALFTQEGDPNAQIGGCLSLQNVVPDRHSRGIYAPRPAYAALGQASTAPATAGITTIGDIVAYCVLGSRVYGMASCMNNAGTLFFDMPFCYDSATSSFVTITGFTTANLPTDSGYPNGANSGSAAADWVPPHMEQVGSKIIVCHQGFSGTGNFIGWIDISNPAAPTWSAGNLSGGGGLTFTVPPVSVTQFNGRAYYAVGGTVSSNNVIFSDSLNATVCTNATQVLTIGDNQPIIGFGQQPYQSTTIGGIIQSILAFKANSIAQITGDPTTSNLAVSVIKTGTGTVAANTIASTPLGCMFMASDGVRYVDVSGNVSQPLPSVRNPFANSTLLASLCFPTTACAAYNSNMYRISLYTTDLSGNVFRQEYVFDMEYGWHGPHQYGVVSPFIGAPAVIAAFQSSFVVAMRTIFPLTVGKNDTQISTSSLAPGPADSFFEGTGTINWNMQGCSSDDGMHMLVKNIGDITIAYNPGNTSGSITVTATPTPVGTAQTSPAGQSSTLTFTPSGALWGTAVWGSFTWGGSYQSAMTDTTVTMPAPVAYKRIQWQVSGTAALNQRIGPISYRGNTPGYTNQDLA